MLRAVIDRIAGDRGWHKGHDSSSCPLVVERDIRIEYGLNAEEVEAEPTREGIR